MTTAEKINAALDGFEFCIQQLDWLSPEGRSRDIETMRADGGTYVEELDAARAALEAGCGDVTALRTAIDRVLNLTGSIGPEARRILREATGLESSTE